MSDPTHLRAPRFITAIPLRYRGAEPDGAWHVGLSINVSESGVLFEASDPLPLGTWITITFDEVPAALGLPASGPVTYVAEVVRQGRPTQAVPYPVAAQFLLVRETWAAAEAAWSGPPLGA